MRCNAPKYLIDNPVIIRNNFQLKIRVSNTTTFNSYYLNVINYLFFQVDQNFIKSVHALNRVNKVSAKKEFANPGIMANLEKSFID